MSETRRASPDGFDMQPRVSMKREARSLKTFEKRCYIQVSIDMVRPAIKSASQLLRDVFRYLSRKW